MTNDRDEQPGLFEALYSTRALRRFTDRPVDDETLFQVLDAAIRAPAHSRKRSLMMWSFPGPSQTCWSVRVTSCSCGTGVWI